MTELKHIVLICGGGGCLSSDSQKLIEKMKKTLREFGMENEVKVVMTGCMGLCALGPTMIVNPQGVFYKNVQVEDIPEIVARHLRAGEIVEQLLYEDPDTGEKLATVDEIPFFYRQKKIALRNMGSINPLDIDDYIAHDGYFALTLALREMTPAQVVQEVKDSGLRGRGGAGFPTGIKWELTAKAKGSPKYVVCNADEGDPGAFMDRSIIEGDPHTLIEGMIIAGYAVGAHQGNVYIRAEYPLAVERLKEAIKQARKYNFLGKNIMGSGFNFDIEIRVGAGAFVCGEETALLASVEGRRGEPRPKPPFPANEGLWAKPTVINNVETYANVPVIIQKGADWFKKIGTEKSPGTKVFALAGNVRNTGLVEVPMGTTLGDIIYDIGGGIIGDKPFKAAQTGGPSGGCIPPEYLNVPIDYESLSRLGTIMGSGGLIIMDEDTCMVDLAKFFQEFVQEESCGKCTPCRVGTKRMLEILDRITKGEGREGDIEALVRLGEDIKDTALCGLGQSAPNPVLNTIRYFRHEYEEHVRYKRCQASNCATMFESPCKNACPAGVDVPRYIEMIQRRQFDEAVRVIRENNPLPAICGRVCNHPCEAKCQRAKVDDPIAIRALKRFAADYELAKGHELLATATRKRPWNGKSVAVIGSGPAGLTAAYYLAQWGYRVVLYEEQPVLGGMLALTIPEYRLPKDVLLKEIDQIIAEGIEVVTGVKVGRDIPFEEIRQDFDAVFIGIGSHKSLPLNIPGQDLHGVYPAIEFLKAVNMGRGFRIGRKVVVVGGGNSAFDAARVAKRLGAEEVSILYRRAKKDMPAEPMEVREAEKEGIHIVTQVIPIRVLDDGQGRVAGMECARVKMGEFDNSGRRKPVLIQDSKFVIEADMVLAAIGLFQDIEGLPESDFVGFGGGKNIRVDRETMMTSEKGVFAGGDCVHGPDTVIQAIADGKRAAYAVDRYLGGTAMLRDRQRKIERKYFVDIIEHQTKRVEEKLLPLKLRKGSFAEVEHSLSEEEAVTEALRCLRCDVKQQ